MIVGTAAFNREKLTEIADAVSPERLIIALDSKAGKVVTHGWQEATNVHGRGSDSAAWSPSAPAFSAPMSTKKACCRAPISIGSGVFARRRKHELTAAGGITTIEEIQELQKLGIHAALGMAIYTGRLDLAELALLNA